VPPAAGGAAWDEWDGWGDFTGVMRSGTGREEERPGRWTRNFAAGAASRKAKRADCFPGLRGMQRALPPRRDAVSTVGRHPGGPLAPGMELP
jgi:hypothetical protein